MWIWWLQKIRN